MFCKNKKTASTNSSSTKYDVFSKPDSGPNSSARSFLAAQSRSFLVVAIVEGRGAAKGEVGVANMDLRHPQLNLAQFADTAVYNNLRIKLHALNPIEIIFPDSAVDGERHVKILFSTLKEEFPLTKLSLIPRKHFNQARAMEMIKNLKTPDCGNIEKDIAGKYYCMSAAHGLLSYIEHIQNIIFAPSSVKVVYSVIDKACMIDLTTAKTLELIVSAKDCTKTDNSLFSLLNRTFTHGGERMLRANILQPPTDLTVIQERLDAIEELLSSENLFASLNSLLSRMVDVDQMVALCSHINSVENAKTAEYKLTQVMRLKHMLEFVKPFYDALSSMKSPLLAKLSHLLIDDRFAIILHRINEVMNEEVRLEKSALNSRTQKCYAIKGNINGLLDISRRTYAELSNDANTLCGDVSSFTKLPFNMYFSNTRGFYLQLYLDGFKFPDTFSDFLIQVVRRGRLLTCSTLKLVSLNERINDVVGEILTFSNVVISELLTKIRDSITCLYNLTEVVSTVDFLLSLASVCTVSTTKMTRPVFMDSLAAKDVYHPILEKFLTTTVTPNDLLITPSENFVIITGPNMAGKSTYLKMVALLQVMAQMGSYVTACDATFRIADRIFARVGQNDDLENSVSSFQQEISDVKYILENFSDNSLIVIDELCRSTSAEEGLALSWAISEQLIQSKAFVVLSTHFLDLGSLDSLYTNVANFHFEPLHNDPNVDEGLDTIFNHKLKHGAFNGPLYGFEIAEMSLMPTNVIQRAKNIAESLRKTRMVSDERRSVLQKENAAIKFYNKVQQVAKFVKDTDEKEVREHLKRLKMQYLTEIGEN